MHPSEAKRTLLAMILARSPALESVDAATAIDVMLRFFAQQRATDVVGLDEDGDMVLYEWGVFDFGSGPSFQLGLTRQFVLSGDDGDDAIRQLRLILHYDVSAAEVELGRGHRWCHRPEELETFRAFVESSGAAALVADRVPTRVELDYEHI